MRSKVCFFAVVILLFVLMSATVVFAENEVSGESSEVLIEEPPNKKLEWAYWTIGTASIVSVGIIAVAVSKKIK